MKNKLSPTLAGTFVIGALVLIVTGLLTLRSCNVFSRPGHFTAYFNESVQGLDVGSAVKLRGVPLGRVKSIRVHYDETTRQSQVVVLAELNQNMVADAAGHLIKLTDRATLQRLIDQGLRAKIDLVGITGLQFVELDFFDPQQFPAPPEASDAEYPVVPTLRSGMSELVENLSKIAGNKDCRAASRTLPGAEYHVFRTGHIPFAEAPEEFMDKLQPFLDRVTVDNRGS